MHPGPLSATLESLTASGCSPLRMGAVSQERCATSHAFWFDILMRQLLLQERVMSVFDEFNSSELI